MGCSKMSRLGGQVGASGWGKDRWVLTEALQSAYA